MHAVAPRAVRLAAALAAALVLGGCDDAGYYGQAIAGQLELMARARPVDAWLADPRTEAALKQQLELAQQLRAFSVQVLQLPDNPSYRSYADLKRAAAVWNVVAAPPLSLQLERWCYPLFGCVSYRGYFDRHAALALAAQLQADGLETDVYPVPAYSTLGWSNWAGGDPLLNTFVGGAPQELARLMFHELAHQQLYVADDTAFNESFATAVARLGLDRWLQAHGDAAQREQDRVAQARAREFRALVQRTRDALDALYRSDADDAAKRTRKAELLARLQADYRRLRDQRWGGWSAYDGWFADVNNAKLALLGTYADLVDAFMRLYAQQGGDFERFYAEAARIGALPKAERHATLRALTEPPNEANRVQDPRPS